MEYSCTDGVLIYTRQTSTKKSNNIGKLFCNVVLCFSMRQIRVSCKINFENQRLDNNNDVIF